MSAPKYIKLNGVHYMHIDAYTAGPGNSGDFRVRHCEKGEAKQKEHKWCLCDTRQNHKVLDSFVSHEDAMKARKDAMKARNKRMGKQAHIIQIGDTQYVRVDASHPIEDTDGVPLSDVGKSGEKSVQQAIKDSRNMYYTQKGSSDGKKKPKETGVNLDRNGPPPHADGAGAGDGDGGGDGGGGE